MFYIVPDKASAKPIRSGEYDRKAMGSNNILTFAFCKVQIGMLQRGCLDSKYIVRMQIMPVLF